MTTVTECTRCKGRKSNNRQCSRSTCKYPDKCWQHTIQKDKLKIAPSKIEDGGQGLYTLQPIKKGETVTDYGGKIITQQEFNNDPSEYAVQVTKNLVLDGRSTQSGLGRYANACQSEDVDRGDCKGNNSKFAINPRQKSVKIKAVRNIKSGEEIYVAYGKKYWGK